jgi:tetratricopeptide (TPR) repeat protein
MMKEEDFESGVNLFEKALQIDPDYALGYVGLAWAFQHKAISGNRKAFEKVIQNAEKSYQLNPQLAETNMVKAGSYSFQSQPDKAFLYYKEAYLINPNISELNFSIGVFFYNLGLTHQAKKYSLQAVELDPLYVFPLVSTAGILSSLGKFEEAEVYFKKAQELDPKNVWLNHHYFLLLLKKRELTKAKKHLKTLKNMGYEQKKINRYQAMLFALQGENETALSLYRKKGWTLLIIYSSLGMKDEALKLLEEGYEDSYLNLNISPFFDKLRDDPRFQKIISEAEKTYKERLKKYEDL